ncbi:uncharacterized protein PV07_12791 [Cladophialophora immunda]|uniref:SP-RING-type domain-containing protein n=1 Tax=Cladophialophora immunda TaxID=569365 RepID=A0A0D1Z272_9EURO|nr:uncharacterized protein PV07_12791 [Cladophialophora immunda]KIW21781.1 hypothetical protein PV07_12791 [Cladophialophora immunda]
MVADIRRGRAIPRDQVIQEMRRKAEDPDEVVATSMVLSLKDPVGHTRITTPCRGICCVHLQCFDAALYLQLQKQAPTWTCPICNKAAGWEQLALDQFVNDILNQTPKSVEAVTVPVDGRWYIPIENNTVSCKPNPMPLVKTEPLSSGGVTTAPSASEPKRRKRHGTPEIIDLTGSDDEEFRQAQPQSPLWHFTGTISSGDTGAFSTISFLLKRKEVGG